MKKLNNLKYQEIFKKKIFQKKNNFECFAKRKRRKLTLKLIKRNLSYANWGD